MVADFGPRNVERLISFLEIARETGRQLSILPKDAYLIDAMRCGGGSQVVPPVDSPGVRIYWEHTGDRMPKWKEQVQARYPSLAVTPKDVRSNQQDFICCLSFWDVQELAYIKPVQGSVWIYSTCEAFNEEMQIDLQRLKHWLDFFGMEFVGGKEADACFHVSGHASGSDLLSLVEAIRPKTLVPLHTEHPDIYADKAGHLCNVVCPELGVSIQL